MGWGTALHDKMKILLLYSLMVSLYDSPATTTQVSYFPLLYESRKAQGTACIYGAQRRLCPIASSNHTSLTFVSHAWLQCFFATWTFFYMGEGEAMTIRLMSRDFCLAAHSKHRKSVYGMWLPASCAHHLTHPPLGRRGERVTHTNTPWRCFVSLVEISYRTLHTWLQC